MITEKTIDEEGHMSQLVKRQRIYEELFDKTGKPRFIEPLGDPITAPLRVTVKEWETMCTCWYNDTNVFFHHNFTMTSTMSPCSTRHVGYKMPDGTIVDHGAMYDREITIACPSARPRWAIFGPYERGHNRAVERAREYLVKAGVLVIIDGE